MNEKDIIGSIAENIKSINEDVRGDNLWMLQQLADHSLFYYMLCAVLYLTHHR
jgi:hypothetical protein